MLQTLESLGAGVVLARRGGIIGVDGRFADLLGRPPAALVGMTVNQLTHPEDLACNLTLLDWLDKTNEPFRLQKRYAQPDGSWRWAEIRCCKLRPGGEDPLYMAVGRSVSDPDPSPALLDPTLATSVRELGEYVLDMTEQLAAMAQQAKLDDSATALRLAGLVLTEELEFADY